MSYEEIGYVWMMAGLIAGPLAYHFRITAGQPKWTCLILATLTFCFPVLLFQDLEHARNWNKR